MDQKPRYIEEREAVEVARSKRDAEQTAANESDRFPRNVQRYINPPPNSWHSWEYAYSLIGNVEGKTVLDLGCGAGENSYVLALRGAKVVGIDISPDLIALARRGLRAKELHRSVALIVASAHSVPVGDHSVDLVFGTAILHHLDLPPVSREVHRVLRRGGTAVFIEPVRDSRLLRGFRSVFPNRSPDISPFERPLTSHELQTFALNFDRFSVRHFSLPHIRLADTLRVSAPISKCLHRLDRMALAYLPFLRVYSSTQVIQLTK